jgi:hypothetical protein
MDPDTDIRVSTVIDFANTGPCECYAVFDGLGVFAADIDAR